MYLVNIGPNKANKIKKTMIKKATIEALFLVKRLSASLKYPTGFVASSLSEIFLSGSAKTNLSFSITYSSGFIFTLPPF